MTAFRDAGRSAGLTQEARHMGRPLGSGKARIPGAARGTKAPRTVMPQVLGARRDRALSKAVPYGPVARLADRWAGVRDGRAGIPALTPAAVPTPQKPDGVTPYLDIQARRFLDRAEGERQRMTGALSAPRQRLEAVRGDKAAAEEKAAEIRKRLDGMAGMPDQITLARRNAVEQHAHEALVRDRRQREHEAARGRLLAEQQHALDAVRGLYAEEAGLAELIACGERVLSVRVRRLHQHTLRRCGTYKRSLVHKHPDGTAVISLLDLGQPILPDWLGEVSQDADPVPSASN